MTRKDLEDTFGKSSAQIASALTALGFPISRQAVNKWRGTIPQRSARIIKTIARGKVKAA